MYKEKLSSMLICTNDPNVTNFAGFEKWLECSSSSNKFLSEFYEI